VNLGCEYILSNNSFDYLEAGIEGGAIYYDKFRPKQPIPNIFGPYINAPYGAIFGSYPYSIKLISYDREILGSGQNYNGLIKIKVIDPELNIINTDTKT
jgi:hypothetical protein